MLSVCNSWHVPAVQWTFGSHYSTILLLFGPWAGQIPRSCCLRRQSGQPEQPIMCRHNAVNNRMCSLSILFTKYHKWNNETVENTLTQAEYNVASKWTDMLKLVCLRGNSDHDVVKRHRCSNKYYEYLNWLIT